jgi:TonB family protein
MKMRIASLIGLGALLFALPAGAVPAVDFPVLEQFTVPLYPFLARLAGTEGTVGLDISLDPHCEIKAMKLGDGESRLVDAVERSFYGEYTHLRFRPCAMSQPVVVHILYTFTLQGQPTNEWSVTKANVTSDHGRSFKINITTTPADLGSLGLERKKQQTTGTAVQGGGSGAPVQTIFISPNDAARGVYAQGDVRVSVDLDSDCRVSNAKVLTGHFLLGEEVLRAVREWQFPGCSSEKQRLELVFHFLLTEPDSPSPLDNWAPTDFEMVGPYEFKIRTVSPDPVIYN